MQHNYKTIYLSFSISLISSLLIMLSACQMKKETTTTHDSFEKEQLPKWISKDYVMGHFDPATHDNFQLINLDHADRDGLYLHKEAYRDFIKMWEAAQLEGISLIIKSATRNFDYQKGIWERKWNGETKLSDGIKASDIKDKKERALKILLYSSMPGTSRHHWGTDIDLNNFNNSYFESGAGLKVYSWLQSHASSYGFGQPYTDKSEGRTGYEEEKWHWSYLPLSKELTSYCEQHLSNDEIGGFAGSEVAVSVDMLNNYILGIDSDCLKTKNIH